MWWTWGLGKVLFLIGVDFREILHAVFAASLGFAAWCRFDRALLVDALSAQEKTLRVGVAVLAQLFAIADRLERSVRASVAF